MKPSIKQALSYVAIIALFAILAYGFVPQTLSGKIVNQSDISGWRGMAQETISWNAAHPDDKTRWSDSMFGGMPNITSLDDFDGDWTKPLYQMILWGKRPAAYLFIALLGAFLMMLSLGINKFLAIAGAIAVAFCSYNFQIIQVGHNTKMQAIAFAPWAIAAFVYTYRSAFGQGRKPSRWLPFTILGSVLFGLALSFQIKANHVQITYYLAIILLIYAIASFVWVLKSKEADKIKRFFIASAFLLAVGVVGIGTNANKLIPTADYAKYTMRGGSELTQEGTNSKGLSIDYATAWSYGIEETPNLLIPNFNGGSSSGAVGKDSATWELFRKAGQNPAAVCSALPLYWGPQPFTAGPMYVGAICIFLFVLGLFLLKGREKWWLLASCIIAILLSWGNHFMWFTKLWFDYAPMYSKFRTVSMALVVLQFCVPLLGFYVLDKIIKTEIPHQKVVKAVLWSAGITAGFCLLCALIPGIAGSFVSSSDSQIQDVIADAIRQDRRSLLRADAWRSFILIAISAIAILWSYGKKDTFVVSGRLRIAGIIISVLVLFDMWSIGKRYLNDDDFITPKKFNSTFDERPVDKYILEDTDPSYRVLDLSENTFNSSVTSYHHKSVGGYSPTKMQRYQDLIERYLTSEIGALYGSMKGAKTLDDIENAIPDLPVLGMLNTRYVIVDPNMPPVVNPYAFGPAWFVSSVQRTSTADEEIAAVGKVDLRSEAVVRNEAECPDCVEASEDAAIEMTYYAPNEVRYSYTSPTPAIAVFSEIYHPSWTATLNGEPLDLFRADWVLRAASLPAGSGEIVMRFDPSDVARGATLSRICSILLILLTLCSLAFIFIPRKEK